MRASAFTYRRQLSVQCRKITQQPEIIIYHPSIRDSKFRQINLVIVGTSRRLLLFPEWLQLLNDSSRGRSIVMSMSVCLSVWCVTFAESEPYCHSILFVCLSVIPRPTAYHDWSITIKFGRQVYTCPRTRVSLFRSPISHTLGARGKNMQNFAYCVFLPLRTWRIVPYDLSFVWLLWCTGWHGNPGQMYEGISRGSVETRWKFTRIFSDDFAINLLRGLTMKEFGKSVGTLLTHGDPRSVFLRHPVRFKHSIG